MTSRQNESASFSPDEERRSRVLDRASDLLASGLPLPVQQLAAGSGLNADEVKEDLAALALIYECAAQVWHDAQTEYTPVSSQDLPNPFPSEFVFRQQLGEGNFGKVYLAEDVNLNRQVAIKMLKVPAGAPRWAETLTALRNEAQCLARLAHPNIVRVLAWRETQGQHFLMLEFVEGGTLKTRSQDVKLGWSEATRYVADAGEALQVAHNAGIVHRDIKPDNLLWDRKRDEAVLTDFGISARLADPASMAGTPLYMAPEAFDGGISPAMDVYSLGATLFHLIAGKSPYQSKSMEDLIQQKRRPLEDDALYFPGMPEVIENCIRRSLCADPTQRPSVQEFVEQLRTSLNQLLADTLQSQPAVPGNSQVQLRVYKLGAHGLDAVDSNVVTNLRSRDMRRVPAHPERIALRTGDEVTIEVSTNQSGYVTLFNIGPTGNLNLLHPADITTAAAIKEHIPLRVSGIEMTPPTGNERLFAVWSRSPFPIRPDQLLSFTSDAGLVSPAYQATRHMKRLRQTVDQLPPQDWAVAVVELAHRPI